MPDTEAVIARGRRAAQLLKNEDLTDVLAELKVESISSWQQSEHAADRERQWLEVKMLERLVTRLEVIVERGQHAQMALDRTQKRSQ